MIQVRVCRVAKNVPLYWSTELKVGEVSLVVFLWVSQEWHVDVFVMSIW